MSRSAKPLALYIHWPFCLAKCPYCDFNSHVQAEIDTQQWQRAYLLELANYRQLLQDYEIKSIFFGGGTPSLMPISLVAAILSYLASIQSLNKVEITLEVNPTSAEAQKLQGFATAGINRLSIGIQALRPEALKFLGRNHDIHQSLAAINLARKYFNAYSIDLIYARPEQRLIDWQQELLEAIDLAHGHLSLYQLTIEKGTPFFAQHRDKKFILPDDQLATEMYNLTRQILAEHQYQQYEISNYAVEGQESRHNLSYWLYDEYLGIGPGAHSRLAVAGKVRAINMYYQPQKWLQQLETYGIGLQHDLALTTDELKSEIILMGSRINQGISDDKIQKYLGSNFEQLLDQEKLAELQQLKLLECSPQHLRLTTAGLILHNSIVTYLL